MVLPFQLCQLRHTPLSGAAPLPACSPWQTSMTRAPPTSWVSDTVQASSSQLHAVTSLGFHAETPLPYTWPQRPFPEEDFTTHVLTPRIPHDSKAWTTQLMLPSSAASLEWSLAGSVNCICIIFDLLMLFGSRKPFRPLPFINCRIIRVGPHPESTTSFLPSILPHKSWLQH